MPRAVPSARDASDLEDVPVPRSWAPLTSFVGRQTELDHLEKIVASDRLVTLHGPGGSGKTRLALALRDRLVGNVSLGVFVVELASLSDVRLVPAAIAQGLGVRGPSDRSAMDLVVERLSEGQSLLILDNLEQLPAIDGPVRELLGRCPSLRVLATSRRPLRISGERRYEVDPLDTPDGGEQPLESLISIESVALFVARASAIDREFEMTADNAQTIAAICRQVDGLPLAIELAAARVGLLSPSALLRRLETCLGVLTEGPADAPRRHTTLRDTIAWSYDLLGPIEAASFEHASVFVGGFTEAAASAVLLLPDRCAPSEVLSALGTLVDHSLLRVKPGRDGEPRFQMLETIREFASERLSEPEVFAARHAAYFLAVAEAAEGAIEGPEQALWAERLGNDIDNVRTALEWLYAARKPEALLRLAAAMGSWSFMGDLREGQRWLDLALEVGRDTDPRLEATALRRAASLAHGLAEHEVHDALIQRARIMSESIEDDHGVAEALLIAGSASADRGDSETASATIAHGLDLARNGGDDVLVAKLRNRLAIFGAGEGGRLIEVFEDNILELRRGGNERELGLSLLNLSFCYLVADRPTDALAAIAEASEILERLGERSYLGVARLTEGLTRLHSGDASLARRLLGTGIAMARETGNVNDMIYGLEATADWLGLTGHHEDAVVLWSAAHQISLDLDMPEHPVDLGWITAGRARDERRLRADRCSAASAKGMSLGLESALDAALELMRSAHILDAAVQPASAAADRFAPTPRELEVLALLVDGRSDGEIAERLFISPKTASVHVANLKGKLGADSRVEIATLAMRRGLARPSGENPAG